MIIPIEKVGNKTLFAAGEAIFVANSKKNVEIPTKIPPNDP